MTELDKMRQWLQSYPGWQDTLQVDFTEPAPGNAGLFSEGLEERSRQEDILGNLHIACRYRFALYWRRPGRTDGRDDAQWLLDFQNWVQQQNAAGLTPHFGDVLSRERLQAQKGALQNASQTGTYKLTLIADFMKVYEVN